MNAAMMTETTSLLVGALVIAALSVGCGTNAVASSDAGMTTDGDVLVDAGTDAAGDASSPSGPQHLLSLDPTLDADDSTVKATSISSADLLDATGATVTSASMAPGGAVFALAGHAAGDYFIRVNGDDDDLVPTRLDPRVDTWQRVGGSLRDGYVGSGTHALYRITTWTDSPVVGFSNDVPVPGQHAYAIFTLASAKLEIRVLGPATPLTSWSLTGTHPGNAEPFDSWTINTPGKNHHGDAYNADGGPDTCSSCHTNFWMKKPTYVDITPSRGWCFACHDGPTGPSVGLIDPAK